MSEVSCPQCGHSNKVFDDSCVTCGTALNPADLEDATSVLAGFSRIEISLMLICLDYGGGGSIPSLRYKLEHALARAKAIHPNDASIQLGAEEAYRLSQAVDLAMSDAVWARVVGPPADAALGKVRLSDLSEHTSTLRSVSRRLDIIGHLAWQNERLEELDARVGALEKEMFDA